jgi:hypothetical protein
MTPEITLADPFGQAIAKTIETFNIRSVIEVGSGEGAGSTECIAAGMWKVSPADRELVCIEANPDRFANLAERFAGLPWVTAVNSRSVSRGSMTPKSFDDVWSSPHNGLRYPREAVAKWWNEQHDGPGYLETLPSGKRFDAALIDGCEFTGFDDFRLLKDRVRVVMLDDTFSAYKCRRAEHVLRFDPEWHCVWSSIFVRNGASIWVRAA